MVLTALLLAALSPHQPIDLFDEFYSVETKTRYETYLLCFAKGSYAHREDSGSPEARMKEAKAACRKEYDSFVAGVVKDSKGSSDTTSAALRARSFFDEMDARAVVGPPAPAKLAQLPVSHLVGEWRLGGGAMAVVMTVHFTDDGSLVGTLDSDFEFAAGLRTWKVTSDGTKNALLHASFADKRLVQYNRIPSFPTEVDFINATNPNVQRFDLVIEDDDLLIRVVTPDGGTQLRFRRQIGTSRGKKGS